ncbi:4a-hydroxytetrahydrobiopterin dehydratase [Neorhizobium galegae]|uniref:4a-hydroxytetrahydrobiopterin dehydratase n=1 Tax=Neorhizobium galegae TaxID=399 RepID=UPI001AE679C9|nr:4a-hydroxytetrahydrobiopterin dehydratase [Neorhizobium galegae]MBP2562760.1 4a-hydroxytetrahydrobiopterin dehydratase [Neorhizobium galegae]MDQ0137333.1 4a-hydroxytetrahydrobiopterin dehydratase [Neorhizobium galegae]
MNYEKLDAAAVERELATVDGWELKPQGDAIFKSFKFRTFIEAFGFMAECALSAEKLNHHPEWSNVYSRVDVLLTTHATKGLTDIDFKLARAMDKASLRRN